MYSEETHFFENFRSLSGSNYYFIRDVYMSHAWTRTVCNGIISTSRSLSFNKVGNEANNSIQLLHFIFILLMWQIFVSQVDFFSAFTEQKCNFIPFRCLLLRLCCFCQFFSLFLKMTPTKFMGNTLKNWDFT